MACVKLRMPSEGMYDFAVAKGDLASRLIGKLTGEKNLRTDNHPGKTTIVRDSLQGQ